MQALVLKIDTPPGLPRSQLQVARLEALHRSPLPVERVEVLLARRQPWRPGREGRFHAALARREDAPAVGEAIELEVDGELVRFERDGGGLRRAGPAVVVAGLAATAVAIGVIAGWTAGRVEPPVARPAMGKGGAAAQIATENARLVADLIAARDAFGTGRGLRAIEWTPQAVVVETERSDATAATGDGRAFEKLARTEGAAGDRWRLAPPPGAGRRP